MAEGPPSVWEGDSVGGSGEQNQLLPTLLSACSGNAESSAWVLGLQGSPGHLVENLRGQAEIVRLGHSLSV